MKITDKQEKSKAYLAAVITLRDKKDELVRQNDETIAKIATIKAELEGIAPQMVKAVDVDVSKALRTKKRELQEALEDIEAVKLNILDTLTALNGDLRPLRLAAMDELAAFNDAANAEIEAIQENARELELDVRDAMSAQPCQMADKIIYNILKQGGWQNKDGGHMSEPVKHKSTKDGPDRLLNDRGLGEFRKPEKTESAQWGRVGRMMGEHPGK